MFHKVLFLAHLLVAILQFPNISIHTNQLLQVIKIAAFKTTAVCYQRTLLDHSYAITQNPLQPEILSRIQSWRRESKKLRPWSQGQELEAKKAKRWSQSWKKGRLESNVGGEKVKTLDYFCCIYIDKL